MSLLKRAARVSDIHTLEVVIRVLAANRANPTLVNEVKDLLARIEVALEANAGRNDEPDPEEAEGAASPGGRT